MFEGRTLTPFEHNFTPFEHNFTPFKHNFAPFKHRELLLIILIIVRFFFVKTETNLKIAKPDRLFIIFDFYFGGKIRKCENCYVCKGRLERFIKQR